MFVDIVSSENFLFASLRIFFDTLDQDSCLEQSLVTKARRFKEHLERKFEWDFAEEEDEDRPVVVDLDAVNVTPG